MKRSEFLAAGLGLALAPDAFARSLGGTPVSLSNGTLCVLDRGARRLHTLSVARSSHDVCFVMSM